MKKIRKGPAPISITNCNFHGVVWDGKAIEAVNTVAKGLLNLTELFRSQNIQVECMLKVESKKADLGG